VRRPAGALAPNLRRVDADRIYRRFRGANSKPVFERAQLLEAFGHLERRRRECRQVHQELAPVGVEAEMLP
jgi:hypothetical protein